MQEDPTGGEAEERWRAFYLQRKIRHFDSLAEHQKRRIVLMAEPPPMIHAHARSPPAPAPPPASAAMPLDDAPSSEENALI